MLEKALDVVRAALRRRTTYLVLLVVVVVFIMVPVVRIEAPSKPVGELHALVYALQRAQASGRPTISIPETFGEREWARAAGEADVTVWRASAMRTFRRSPVVVFSKSYCPHSRRAKELLATFALHPPPLIFELDQREDGRAIQDMLQRLTGRGTVPNILTGPTGKSIGGADDIVQLHADGELSAILDQALLAAKHDT